MSDTALRCLVALVWVGCAQPVDIVDGGFAGRLIAGVVTDSAGTPVAEVDVQGFHTGVLGFECGRPVPGFRGWPTDEKGKYFARISEMVHTGGAGQRCLFLEFLPPEGSRLESVSIDSMQVDVYSSDPVWLADTLFINVTLPVGGEDG